MTNEQAKTALYNQYLLQRKARQLRELRQAEREYSGYRRQKDLQFCKDARNRRI